MPFFQHKNYLVACNYKVMYSTLKTQDVLSAISGTAALRLSLLHRLRLKKCPMILITRNPYSRLVSFFEDKLQRFPRLPVAERIVFGRDDRRGWQRQQTLFFPLLNIDSDTSNEEIARRMQSLSFEGFIKLLPLIHCLDPHLRPQKNILLQTINFLNGNVSLRFCMKPTRIVKMESLVDQQFLASEIGLDLSRKVNVTNYHGRSWDEYFSKSLYEVANSVYSCDFDMFGYDRR